MSYRKHTKGYWYDFVKEMRAAGIWVCDAVTHNNDKTGCMNPNCWKHRRKKRGR